MPKTHPVLQFSEKQRDQNSPSLTDQLSIAQSQVSSKCRANATHLVKWLYVLDAYERLSYNQIVQSNENLPGALIPGWKGLMAKPV